MGNSIGLTLALLHDQKIGILILKAKPHGGLKVFQEVIPSSFSDFSHASNSFKWHEVK